MSTSKTALSNWFGFIPRRGPGLIGFIVVVILAFSLGLFLSGGEDTTSKTDSRTDAQVSEDSTEPTVWTCSMHPQIQLPKPGKCPICFMDLIPLETSGKEGLDPRQLRMSETAKQLARIETTPAWRDFAQAEIRMVGKLAYDETKVAYITAWVPGRLDRLYADFTGITVQKGDHMVYMYSPELLAAQEELFQSKAAIAALTEGSMILRTTAAATLEAAREKLRLYGLTPEQIEEIEATGETTDHLTIYAPIGGVVVHKNALEGMYVNTGTRIYTIANLTKLWVYFDAYESDLPWLRYGQKVQFTSPSFPGETFNGLITFIDPFLSEKTRTVKIRAIVDNKYGKLKPEMFVSGVVKSRLDSKGNVVDENLAGKWIGPMHPEIVKNGPGDCDICGMPLVPAESLGYAGSAVAGEAPLLIPASAPLLTGTRAVVYVEIPNEEEPLFEGRVVVLGPRAGDFYVVKSGLSEGELVVTNGAFKIDSELQIQAKPSMMSPEGGQAPPVHQHGQERDMSPATGETKHEPGAEESQPIALSPDALDALAPLYDAYFKVQMALASDDLASAVKSYSELADRVNGVNMSLFMGDAHQNWMDLSEKIKQHSTTGASSPDLTAARESFYDLSKAMIQLHETFGHSGVKSYYLTFCPMYDDNRGAHWLQTIDTVYNSFYGASMLRCGEIKETLAAEVEKGD